MSIDYRATRRDALRDAARRCRWPAFGLAMLIGSVCQAQLGAAQMPNPLGGSSDARPIDITADSGIEWQQDQQVYIARGNAVAKRGANEVHADTLTAHYRPSKSKSAEGGNEVYRLDADGHVVIKGPTQTVIGDQAVYDVDQQIGVVTGKHLKLTTPTDVVTARDSLEWYDQQQVAVARGDALAIRADRRIRADVLTAHFVKDKGSVVRDKGSAKPGAAAASPADRQQASIMAATGAAASAKPAPAKPSQTSVPTKAGAGAAPAGAGEGSSRISRVDAQGHVVVVTATDIGRGNYGVYNADTGIVTLLGDVTITRGQDAVKGEYAVVDLNTNVSRIMTVAAKPGAPAPRVEGLFYRQDTTTGPSGAQKPGAKPTGAPAPKS